MQSVAERRNTLAYWLLGILATLLGAAGQLLFRRFGQAQNSQTILDWASPEIPPGAAYLLVGIACYFVAVPLWVRVLRDLPLSRAYPLLSLSYPLVYLGAVLWLGELVSVQRTAGTLLVTLGALLAIAPSNTSSNTSCGAD